MFIQVKIVTNSCMDPVVCYEYVFFFKTTIDINKFIPWTCMYVGTCQLSGFMRKYAWAV